MVPASEPLSYFPSLSTFVIPKVTSITPLRVEPGHIGLLFQGKRLAALRALRMNSRETCTISANRLIRPLEGRSRPILVEGSDHQPYVIKWMRGLRATTGICFEAMRHSIFARIGLPVPQWLPIEVSPEFIHDYLEWDVPWNDGERLNPGIHFATRWVGDSERLPLEALSPESYTRISNRADFWGACVADVWTERKGPRQAVFTPGPRHGEFQAVFIDQGCSMAWMGEHADLTLSACLYPDRAIYEQSRMVAEFREWVERIERIGHAAAWDAFRSLPPLWKMPSAEEMANRLSRRAGELRETIFPFVSCIANDRSDAPKAPTSVRVYLRVCQLG